VTARNAGQLSATFCTWRRLETFDPKMTAVNYALDSPSSSLTTYCKSKQPLRLDSAVMWFMTRSTLTTDTVCRCWGTWHLRRLLRSTSWSARCRPNRHHSTKCYVRC